MQASRLAIAAIITALPTATSFAQSASVPADQSVPRVSPATEPRVSPTTVPRVSPRAPSESSSTSHTGNTRGIPDAGGIAHAPVSAPPATNPDVVRDPRPLSPGDRRAIGAPTTPVR